MAGLTLFLDLVLIGLLVAGISYAVKLSRQLRTIQAGRAEMERFVLDFNTTVVRAENGIKGLKNAARSGGDDLEKLIEQASGLRDELHLLMASADQIATRISDAAAQAVHAQPTEPEKTSGQGARTVAPPASIRPKTAPSAAERELMQALKKIG